MGRQVKLRSPCLIRGAGSASRTLRNCPRSPRSPYRMPHTSIPPPRRSRRADTPRRRHPDPRTHTPGTRWPSRRPAVQTAHTRTRTACRRCYRAILRCSHTRRRHRPVLQQREDSGQDRILDQYGSRGGLLPLAAHDGGGGGGGAKREAPFPAGCASSSSAGCSSTVPDARTN